MPLINKQYNDKYLQFSLINILLSNFAEIRIKPMSNRLARLIVSLICIINIKINVR